MSSKKQMPFKGNEILAVMHGVNRKILDNYKNLEVLLIEALRQENFTILKKISHSFQPHGYTVAILLSQSHAAIHTFPEYQALYFSLYSCKSVKDGKRAYEFLKRHLNPISEDYFERTIELA